jgi:hypothetical protein
MRQSVAPDIWKVKIKRPEAIVTYWQWEETVKAGKSYLENGIIY